MATRAAHVTAALGPCSLALEVAYLRVVVDVQYEPFPSFRATATVRVKENKSIGISARLVDDAR
ncbi:uncharacterized protein LACBIDRAFT_310590 [Laccaria bicolor S238N-H82]|uniref:Predicted protein n=1 Tax=Laccaria bicolor (strain S238N-H82 / ATCC MYA-4686) TaxID=486041 RepID=B0DUN2_LACBS|nr:uncharacterized protein LACBIDRAFT_310590 [Laccaria bicolor S238N-H82]EDR01645.1 predicted protein [Laccaria bicolor S238N-H82]|eukprot:XP_001887721.1 predicted protein [Laccaria bicolor S238N-H82]